MKSNTNQRVSPIFALVLCPTRELAIQLTAEANVLLKYHEGIGVQSLIGGTRFKLDQRRLESDPCQVCHIYRPAEDQDKTNFSLTIFCFLLSLPDFSCYTW
jgi:superfamily II DNA/RNA helicase